LLRTRQGVEPDSVIVELEKLKLAIVDDPKVKDTALIANPPELKEELLKKSIVLEQVSASNRVYDEELLN
jgi:hypothetical protein